MQYHTYSMLKSPMNYVGGKHKILPQLQKLFPVSFDTFVDLFAGGLTVSMNVEAHSYILNDSSLPLMVLYQYLQSNQKDKILTDIKNILEEYGISKTNREGYLKLRRRYNETRHPLLLMVLVSNAFNHQLRFNSKGEFNMPFGMNRHCYNKKIHENLIGLIDFLQTKNVKLTNMDFRSFVPGENQFIYADPPYNNSTAVYNTGWGDNEDTALTFLLDATHSVGNKFALSCVLLHNGIENKVLTEWAKKYHTHQIEWKYTNSNYHKKDRSIGIEACITNY